MEQKRTWKPPDKANHRHDAEYAREIMKRTGMSQRALAQVLGRSDRQLRNFASGAQTMDYPVQYMIEALDESLRGDDMNTIHEAIAPYGEARPPATVWFSAKERALQREDADKLIVGLDRFGAPIHGTLKRDDFGLYIQDADGIDMHRTTLENVVTYTLLDPPPSKPRFQE